MYNKCKCFATFSLRTKSLILICIHGDCNAILLTVCISEINLDFCFAFEIRLLETNSLFQYQTRKTEWFDFFSRMHFVRELVNNIM